MAKKNKGGRPTVFDKETLQKLEDAYIVGATHLEAATYTGIAEATLHNYRKGNPGFSERIKTLRGLTGLQAKINLNKSINEGNMYDSKWHLERRDPDYKPKSSQDVTVGAHKSLIDAIIAKKSCGKAVDK